MKVWHFLTKPRGSRRWDLFLRATGVAGLATIPIALLFPTTIPLVWLVIVGIPANSPLSPILPTTYDPLIVEVGKHAPALIVTSVAVAVYMYTEFVNWHIYAWVLNWNRLEALRHNRWVRWGVERFGSAPTTTILFFAATPLPFWVVRSLAILHRYPIKRFMLATAVGRFPRFGVYAWLGSVIAVPRFLILAAILLGAVVAIGARLARGERILSDVVVDPSPKPKRGVPPTLPGEPPLPLPEDSSA